jgi:hypothetical protein
MALVAALSAVAIGVLAAVQPALAAAAVVLLLGAVLSRFAPMYLYAAALVLALAVPTGWNMNTALPFLSVRIGLGSIYIPVLVALLALLTHIVASFPIRNAYRRGLRYPTLTAAVAVWLGVIVISLLLGLVRNGAQMAFGDVQTYVLYGLLLIPLVGAKWVSDTSAERILSVAALGLTAYSAWVVTLFFSSGLYSAVFAGAYADGTRVGFGTTSLLVLFAPLMVALLEVQSQSRGRRLLIMSSLGVMGLAALLSQSRVVLAALLAALVVYSVWPGIEGLSQRRRIAAMITVAAVAVFGAGAVWASPGLMAAAAGLVRRSWLFELDLTSGVRAATNAALWSRLSLGSTWLHGLGMGSTVVTFATSGASAYQSFNVDNAILSVWLKSGVVGALSLTAVLVAIWSTALRVARKGSSFARAIAAALPFFAVVTAGSTAHLINAASVPVGLAAIVALLVAEDDRLTRQRSQSESTRGEGAREVTDVAARDGQESASRQTVASTIKL